MQDLILHEMHYSGNSYKVRLTAAFLGIKISKLIEYDIRKGETRTPEYLQNINPNGRIPVLQIGTDTFLPESGAACYYLADGSDLIPNDRLEHARMLEWMFFEQYSHEPYIATMCYWILKLGVENLSEEQKATMPSKRTQGEAALAVLDKQLCTRQFLVAEKLTLADIALYAYTNKAWQANPPIFDLNKYPNVRTWCERIAQQPGYISQDD